MKHDSVFIGTPCYPDALSPRHHAQGLAPQPSSGGGPQLRTPRASGGGPPTPQVAARNCERQRLMSAFGVGTRRAGREGPTRMRIW